MAGQRDDDLYDRDGKRISLVEFGRLFADDSYKRVAVTKLSNGVRVSTVWLGLNHSYRSSDPPLIFETMVIDDQDEEAAGDLWRYSTEQEAFDGHVSVVNAFLERLPFVSIVGGPDVEAVTATVNDLIAMRNELRAD